MDGVIIDSEPMHARAAVLALQRYNVDINVEYCSRFIGSTTYYMCQEMVKEFHLDITPEELLAANDEMKKYLRASEGYPVIPYIIDLMSDLHSHGLKLIIASSSPAEDIAYVMETLKITMYFQGFISGSEVRHPKPAPDIFLAAADRLGVSPEECIIIEDSTNGVNAAYAAGIISIGFINPNSGTHDLRKAAFLVEGFDEVDYDFVNRVYRNVHWEPSVITSTDRLIIRELCVEDAAELYRIFNEPEIRSFYEDAPNSIEEEQERRKDYIRYVYRNYGYGQWGLFLRESHKLIGCCGIELRGNGSNGDYEIGYLISSEYQRKGYGYEAAAAVVKYFSKKYQPERITAVIDKQNTPSIYLAVKLGMKKDCEFTRGRRECYRYNITFPY
jgi:HAD superfamily hydrolase (TIGR01509 family)